MVKLAEDGQSTLGELRKVYEGWRYPKEWLTEGFYLGFSKLTYKDGYYYNDQRARRDCRACDQSHDRLRTLQ